MAQEDQAKRLEEAKQESKSQPEKAEKIYKDILSQGPGSSDASVRNYESALLGLGELYRQQNKASDLAQLVQETRSVLSRLTKAKTAKLGR